MIRIVLMISQLLFVQVVYGKSIDWQQWSPVAFKQAKESNKLVLINVG